MSKKILILSASTGGGHNRAANALKESFEEKGYRVEILDSLKFTSPTMDKIISKGYEKSAIYTPKAYGRIYKYSDLPLTKSEVNRNLMLEYMVKKLKKLIISKQPNFIIGTHPFPLMAVCKLKKRGVIDIPTMSILTDYTIHSTWVQNEIDMFITGDEFVKNLLAREGIAHDKIFSYGIPIERNFFKIRTKDEIREDLALDDKFTILLMGGSFGAGNVKDEFKRLLSISKDIQIIVVAGRNAGLKEKLEKVLANTITNKKVHILGFTNNVNELMSISDILVTKPGGLTTTEAILSEIPMIIPYFIPGQEEENLDFLLNNGLALKTSTKYDLKILVEVLMEHPLRLNRIRENMAMLKRNSSAEDIVSLVKEAIE